MLADVTQEVHHSELPLVANSQEVLSAAECSPEVTRSARNKRSAQRNLCNIEESVGTPETNESSGSKRIRSSPPSSSGSGIVGNGGRVTRSTRNQAL